MQKETDEARKARLLAELRHDVDQRQQGYRMRALKIFPHVCARCARHFEGKRMAELTVHHKDFNHDNNPNDGSNWELLCIYCHDDEHAPDSLRAMGDGAAVIDPRERSPIVNPFAALEALVKPEDKNQKSEVSSQKSE
jgi:5-methylcytosine-specific restriction endonuclease McrA